MGLIIEEEWSITWLMINMDIIGHPILSIGAGSRTTNLMDLQLKRG